MNKVELLGREYITEYCYEKAKQDRNKEIYDTYITDGIKAISESLSAITGGKYLSKRYYDVIQPPKPVKEKPEDIINRIKHKLEGLEE